MEQGFDRLKLCWSVPLNVQLMIDTYTMLYTTSLKPPIRWKHSKDLAIDTMASCHQLIGLQPSTRYFVLLMANLTDGEQIMAKTITNGTTSGDAGVSCVEVAWGLLCTGSGLPLALTPTHRDTLFFPNMNCSTVQMNCAFYS